MLGQANRNRFFLVASALLMAARISADDSTKDAELLSKFDQYRRELKAINDMQVQNCNPWEAPNPRSRQPGPCNFKAICSGLQQNAATPFYYRNNSGRAVPNYALWDAEESLHQCYDGLSDVLHPLDPAKATLAARQQYAARYKAQQEFLESVKKNGEETTYRELLEAAATLALDQASKMDRSALIKAFSKQEARTDEQAKSELSVLEKKSEKRFSDATRELYARLLVLESKPMTNGMELQTKFPEWSALNTNPFLNTRLLYNKKVAGGADQLAKNQAQYQKETERIFGIFNDVKSRIAEVLRKRRTRSNSSEIDNLIARVSRIRFSPATVGASHPECSEPNAAYSDSNHSFFVCPQFAQLPDMALKGIIAHELGHSIDPCIASGDFYSMDTPLSDDIDQFPSFTPTIAAPVSADKYLHVDLHGEGPNMPTVDPTSIKLLLPGIGLNHNPLRSVVQCLAAARSVSARLPTAKDLKKITMNSIKKLKASGATEENSPSLRSLLKTQANIPKLLAEKGGCSFISGANGKTQVQEAFADWMSGEVLGKDVSEKDKASQRQLAMESLLSLPALGCGDLGKATVSKVALETTSLGCAQSALSALQNTLDGATRAASDEHPVDEFRIDRIFLANPSLQKALGCSNGKAAHCE